MFKLLRYFYGEKETLGLLFVDGEYVCDTLELPWKNNEFNISCISEGTYPIRRYTSRNNGLCILLENTYPRTGIEIHAANQVSEIRGCIAPGIKSLNIVLHSREKLGKLLALLGDRKSSIKIISLGDI